MSSWIKAGQPAVILAPMEGVTDAPMRAMLTQLGGFQFVVSEFLRISQDVPFQRTFRTHLPELTQGCTTASGTPVQLQLLGGDPDKLALSAQRACLSGAPAIDLNFGCPAPTVNKHDGGATLLKYPNRIREIVREVRDAVPPNIPVSAKLRLGWDSMEAVHLNAQRAEEGGASWITIHARTKFDGYRPPAYWSKVGEVKKNIGIPVVANGEIWTLDDFRRCRDETQCEHFMIGRGALANPFLASQIASELGLRAFSDLEFDVLSPGIWLPLLKRFYEITQAHGYSKNFGLRRIKQWLNITRIRWPIEWFHQIKTTQSAEELFEVMGSLPFRAASGIKTEVSAMSY